MATHPPDSVRESRYFNGLIVLASRDAAFGDDGARIGRIRRAGSGEADRNEHMMGHFVGRDRMGRGGGWDIAVPHIADGVDRSDDRRGLPGVVLVAPSTEVIMSGGGIVPDLIRSADLWDLGHDLPGY